MEENITYNENEIIIILNTIKNICNHNNKCDTCPFFSPDSNGNSCGIQNYPPHRWKIKELEEPKQFKAFL